MNTIDPETIVEIRSGFDLRGRFHIRDAVHYIGDIKAMPMDAGPYDFSSAMLSTILLWITAILFWSSCSLPITEGDATLGAGNLEMRNHNCVRL